MLRIEGLTTSYGPVRALKDVSFTAERGKVTAVLGANGAGKTTLLRTISGLVRPDSGSVHLGEHEDQRQRRDEQPARHVVAADLRDVDEVDRQRDERDLTEHQAARRVRAGDERGQEQRHAGGHRRCEQVLAALREVAAAAGLRVVRVRQRIAVVRPAREEVRHVERHERQRVARELAHGRPRQEPPLAAEELAVPPREVPAVAERMRLRPQDLVALGVVQGIAPRLT